jgi:hypothetical protein
MNINDLKTLLNNLPEESDKMDIFIDFFGSYYPLNAFSTRMITTEDGETFYDVDKHTEADGLPQIPAFVIGNEDEEEKKDTG